MQANSADPPFTCRTGCAACCIAPSLTSALPKMPAGKAAGLRCLHLLDDERCELFGLPERPAVCSGLQPCAEMCGTSKTEALHYLEALEKATAPEPPSPACRRPSEC